jgi:hypothetical protein
VRSGCTQHYRSCFAGASSAGGGGLLAAIALAPGLILLIAPGEFAGRLSECRC